MTFLQMYVTASVRKLCMCASQGGGTLRRWNSQRGGNLRGWNPQEWNSQGGGIHLLGTPREWNSLAGDSSEVKFTCWGDSSAQRNSTRWAPPSPEDSSAQRHSTRWSVEQAEDLNANSYIDTYTYIHLKKEKGCYCPSHF